MAYIELNNFEELKTYTGLTNHPVNLEEDVFKIGDAKIPANLYYNIPCDGLTVDQKIQALKAACEAKLFLSEYSVKKLYQSVHSDKLEKFLKKFPIVGCLSCSKKGSKETRAELEKLFAENNNGRVPRIIKGITAVCDFYHISPEDMVKAFDVSVVQDALAHGLSQAEAAVLTYTLGVRGHGIARSENVRACLKLLDANLKEKNEIAENTALWIAYHPETKAKIINKIVDHAEYLALQYDTPVAAVEAKLSQTKALTEVERIEKVYKKPGFKFSECVFDLHFSEADCGRYHAEILRAGDARMVYLGYDTHCCQKLEDIGESAMMHGLLNPHAGFFVITEKSTNRIVAQAEIWETEDRQTLVFDNIEFANDAEISLYWPTLKTWLEGSPYPNVTMGLGYNMMAGTFPAAPAAIPWVTPYEVYVISYEQESEAPIFKSEAKAAQALENHEVTYYDYVYCDSERRAAYLKKDGVVQEFNDPHREENHNIENEYDEHDEEYEDEEDEELNPF